MRDRKEYYEYQNKLITNIMTLLDEKVKPKNEDFKMSSYINYLESNTKLDDCMTVIDVLNVLTANK